MMDKTKLYIWDIETDHVLPQQGQIVEIGICQLDLNTLKIKRIYSSIVREPKRINKNAWIFKNSNLTYEQIYNATPIFMLRKLLQTFMYLGYNTAYNYEFDFNWLESRGFIIPNRWLDPMKILTPIMQIPHNYYGWKYPSVIEAYNFLFGIKIKEPHRALQDAHIEAKIIKKIIEKNYHITYSKWDEK